MNGMETGVDSKITLQVVSRLHQRVPSMSFAAQSVGQFEEVHLPSSPSSDYTFVLVFADEAEAGIEARRRVGSVQDERGFWYLMFEAPNYKSQDERVDEIVDTVALVLGYPTRIIQKHGFIAWSVTAEVETDGGWRRISSVASLNVLVPSPQSEGRQREYRADAVAPELRPVI